MILNKINWKYYIGKTERPLFKRKWEHFARPFSSEYKGYPLQKAFLKYGPENFIFTPLIECISAEELSQTEQILIAALKARHRLVGYNLTDGGEGTLGRVVSEEVRAKVSLVHKGKKASPETLEKMRIAGLSRVVSDETRQKLREHWRTHPHPMLEKPRSEETRLKISLGNKGKTVPEEVRRKISLGLKGRVVSPETRAKISAARKFTRTQPIVVS